MMIDVYVRFNGSTVQVNLPFADGATIGDLKAAIVDPDVDTLFKNHRTTDFGVADHPAGNPPNPLPDQHVLVDSNVYDAIMQ